MRHGSNAELPEVMIRMTVAKHAPCFGSEVTERGVVRAKSCRIQGLE